LVSNARRSDFGCCGIRGLAYENTEWEGHGRIQKQNTKKGKYTTHHYTTDTDPAPLLLMSCWELGGTGSWELGAGKLVSAVI
jgi:hypothetical protein